MTQAVPGDSAAVSLRETTARIESLLEATAAAGPVFQARVEDLLACMSTLYGAGLARMLQILDEEGVLLGRVLESLSSDELVSGLLVVHDLHPHDVDTRVRQALETVRPYLGSHGGNVDLVRIDEQGVAHLRLLGSCDGCPSSAVTLELAVEDAVRSAAPELTGIEVEAATPTPGLIPVDALRARLDAPDHGAARGTWLPLIELTSLAPGELAGFEVDRVPVCACRVGDELFCFRDRCAHCEQSLAGGVLERRLGGPAGSAVLRCGVCRSHYDVRRAGAGLDDPSEHLEPLPVLVRDGAASVAVPTAAR